MESISLEGCFDNADGISQHKGALSIPIFDNRQKKSPLVTIAIPTFNRPQTLKYALESAFNQQYNNYEIIVVDNNPERNDSTERLMNLYSTQSRLSYFKNSENIGLYGNWNRCFELSRTKWVTLLHDDDYYFPEYLTVMVAYLEKYPDLDALSSKHVWWKEDEHSNTIDMIERDKIPAPLGISSIPKRAFVLTHYVGPVGMIYKKSCFMELGGFNDNYYPISDYVFNWRFFLRYNFKRLNTVTHHYRIGRNISLKPETIEQQEVLSNELRTEYIKANHIGRFMQKLVDAYFLQQMESLSKKCPHYQLGKSYHISKWNPYRIIVNLYVRYYLRFRELFLSSIHKL